MRKQLERKYEFMERRRQLKLLAGEELPPELQEIPTIPEDLLETDDEGAFALCIVGGAAGCVALDQYHVGGAYGLRLTT